MAGRRNEEKNKTTVIMIPNKDLIATVATLLMKPMRLLSNQVLLPLTSLILAVELQAKPLQVYILAGQSNMQGQAKVTTFEHIDMDPATKPMLAEMQNPDGSPKVSKRVWVSSIGCADKDDTEQTGKLTTGFGASQNGPKIGPEFTFGIYMEKATDAPILLIKTAWGGKSLNTDFRPPSAGPYVFNETQLAAFQKQGKDLATIKADKAKETGVKGNVAAIRTENYWDLELTAAKAKDNEIKQKAKKLATEGKLKPADEKAALEKMRSEGLTERERLVLEKGISNFEFHYLGSAKILGGIGKGMAEAMVELRQRASAK